MFMDTTDRIGAHFPPPEGRLIREFIGTLTPEAPEGEYPLRGRDIFAVVSRYQTRAREDACPEAHRRYTDIQLLLSGEERIEWFPLGTLHVKTPYDEKRDVLFHERPDEAGGIVTLCPGMFAVFTPSDAHMPQLMAVGGPSMVTKVVIKVCVSG